MYIRITRDHNNPTHHVSVVSAPCACVAVSFYGDSYLRVPIEDARSEGDIRLHFRTHRSDGLLLLAAGLQHAHQLHEKIHCNLCTEVLLT